MPASPPRAPNASSEPASQRGFLAKLADLLLPSDDPERQKRRMLKNVAKEIRTSRPRLINHRDTSAQPAMALFFYGLYRMFGPAQVLLEAAATSDVLRAILIESFLSPELQETRARLDPGHIKKRAETQDIKLVSQETARDLRSLSAAFQPEVVKQINALLAQLAVFLDLVNFDYYALLKKFDPRLPEGDFTYKPRFETINGEYVSDHLKDFLEILPALSPEADWERILDACKEYRGNDPVSRERWQKSLRTLYNIQKSGLLHKIVMLIDRDPFVKIETRSYAARGVQEYMQKIRLQAEGALQACVQRKRENRRQQYLSKLFGTTSVVRLVNYTVQKNEQFTRRMIAGYTHVASLNYLKAFFLDYLKSEIRETVDLLIVRGKWVSTESSRALSDSLRQLLSYSQELLQLDASLSEDEELGRRIKVTLGHLHKDRASAVTLRRLLRTVNDRAANLVSLSAQQLVILAKVLKGCIEDMRTNKGQLVSNWKELQAVSDFDVAARLANAYQKIFYLVQLLQLEQTATKRSSSAAGKEQATEEGG